MSGPFWYAAGATIQIILFGILAVQIKMKAPSAHTVLEIVHARWGTAGHLVFFFFCFLTNIIVSAMLILGGAAVMTALTGMNTVAVSAAALAQARSLQSARSRCCNNTHPCSCCLLFHSHEACHGCLPCAVKGTASDSLLLQLQCIQQRCTCLPIQSSPWYCLRCINHCPAWR